MTSVGAMTERISIERLESKKDPRTGQPKPEWVEIANAWAEWNQVAGEEIVTIADKAALVTDTFRIRFRPGLNSTMQVRHRDRVLPVGAVLEIDRQTWLLLKCVGVA